MSRNFEHWARRVGALKSSEAFVLMLIAQKVNEAGSWSIKISELAREARLSRIAVRATLDRLAQKGLVAFRVNVYRGKAQAAHTFQLICDEAARDRAIAGGFEFTRRALDRSRSETFPSAADERVIQGASSCLSRVPRPAYPLSTHQNTLSEDRDLTVSCPNKVRTRRAYTEEFEKFWRAYPTDANMSKSKTAESWSRLAEIDRRDALASLPAFLRYCAERPDYRVLHAKNYLSLKERRWEGHLHHAQRPAPKALPTWSPGAPEAELHRALSEAIGLDAHSSWFAEMQLVRVDGMCAFLEVPTRFVRDEIHRRFSRALDEAVRRAWPSVRRFALEVKSGVRPDAASETLLPDKAPNRQSQDAEPAIAAANS